MSNPVDFDLYLITDRTRVVFGHTLVSAVEAALQGGLKAVQLREKDLSAAAQLPLARQLRDLTRRYGARLLVNDRVDLALAVGRGRCASRRPFPAGGAGPSAGRTAAADRRFDPQRHRNSPGRGGRCRLRHLRTSVCNTFQNDVRPTSGLAGAG